MNMKVAAIAGGIAFVLSFLSAVLGGVAFPDLLVRAVIWGIVGAGAAVGGEALIRKFLPELLERTAGDEFEAPKDRAVNIVLEEEMEAPRPFVEEIDEDQPAPSSSPPVSAVGDAALSAASAQGSASPAEDDGEMPEIGSFLDAFKPGSADLDEGASESEPSGFIPQDEPFNSGSSQGVTMDGEAQDPKELARAVRTVLKRDEQGK